MTDDDLTYQIDLPDPDRLTEFSDPVQHYISHVHYGLTFTKIAAAYHSHPSTILRHVRQIEDARDDPLLDQALADLDDPLPPKDVVPMPSIPNAHAPKQALKSPPNSDSEARRILRRLCEKDAVFVVAQDMDRAVVLRPNLEGGANPHGGDGSQPRAIFCAEGLDMRHAQGEGGLLSDYANGAFGLETPDRRRPPPPQIGWVFGAGAKCLCRAAC
ncbi:MAG: hypothetical protein ACPGDA_05245 [Paracoccaceae bacterium]